MSARLVPRPTTDRTPSEPEPAAEPSERDALAARLAALASRREATATIAPTMSRGAGHGKRRHAARGSRIASLGLSVASTGALATFFAMSNAGTGNQVQAASIVTNSGTTAGAGAVTATAEVASPTPSVVAHTIPPLDTVTTTPSASAPPATTPTAPTAPATPIALNVVKGGVFSNKWGEVQVQATFGADGSLVDVVTLQTPSRDGKSVRINDRAVPILNGEALTTQRAHVDTVSGATYTSNDYGRSLQSAIDVAREAGITTLA